MNNYLTKIKLAFIKARLNRAEVKLANLEYELYKLIKEQGK